MAYDEDLADRCREAIQDVGGVSEKRMFGGLAFLVEGHMTVAVSKDGLLLRVDPDQSESLLREDGVTRAVMGGRSLKGWLRVDASAIGSDDDLARWVGQGTSWVGSLPPK